MTRTSNIRNRRAFVGRFHRAAVLTILLACWSHLVAGQAARAAGVAGFYKGRTITISVGFGPGGGYDAYARLIARHLGKYLPGHPAVIVQNVPGGAGLTLANNLFHVYAKDGTQLATFDRSLPLDPLIGEPGAHFQPLKFQWIGSPSNEISSCVAWKTSPVKRFDDLKLHELVVGGTAPSADVVEYPRLLNEFAGTKFHIVTGYPGSSEALHAMEEGETQGFCAWGWASMSATHLDWVRRKDIIPLVQFGAHKDPHFGDAPLARDVVSSAQGRAAMDLITSPQVFARPFATTPGVPAERVSALRTAFDATMRDPDFLAEAKRQHLEIDPVQGAKVQSLLSEVYSTPASVVKRVREALKH